MNKFFIITLFIIIFLFLMIPSYATTVQLLPNTTNKAYTTGTTTHTCAYNPAAATTEFTDTQYSNVNVSDNVYYTLATAGTASACKATDNKWTFNVSTNIPSGATVNWIQYCIEGNASGTNPDAATFLYHYNLSTSAWVTSLTFTGTDTTWCYNTTNYASLFTSSANMTIGYESQNYRTEGETGTWSSSVDFVNVTVSYTARDTTLPTFSNPSINTTCAGKPVNISIVIQDETGLSGYIFSTNNTGTWVNTTWSSLTNGTVASNITTLNSTVGTVVNYTWYANDTASPSNWATNRNSTTTTDCTPPIVTISSPTNTTYAADGTWFNVTLNEAGSWCGRSLDKAANVSMVNSTGNWNNYTTGIAKGSHNVTFCCNDTSNNMNCSAPTVYFTIDNTSPTYSLNSTNSTLAGAPILHSLNWTDNVGLSGFIFQFCNGTWNGTMCLATCTGTYTITLNDTNGGNVGDAGVDSVAPTYNYGTDTVIFVESYSAENGRTFLLWNLSVIPAGATITNANLFLYMISPTGVSRTYNAYNTSLYNSTGAGPWVEGTVNSIDCGTRCALTQNITWNNQPSAETLQQGISTGTIAKWLYWDVTNSAISSFSQANKNMSIMIRDNTESSSTDYYADFASKEYATTTLRPQLVITYTSTYTGNCGWVNDTWNNTGFSGTSSWSNVTKTVNSTVGAWIAWCVYANDTSNNWNGTSCVNPFTYNTTSAALNYSANLTQSLSISQSTSRTGSLLRSVTTSLVTSSALSRSSTLYKSLSEFLTINQILSRMLSSLRSITSYFTFNTVSSRISSFYKALSDSLSLNSVSSRILSSFQSISSYFTLSSSITRTLSSLRSITSSFIFTSTTSRIVSLFQSLSQSLSLSTVSSRILSSLRSITSYFAISQSLSRFYTSLLSLSQSFTTSVSVTRLGSIYRYLTGYLTLFQSTSRIQSLLQSLSQSLTISQLSSRLGAIYESVASSFAFVSLSSRISTLIRLTTSSLTISAVSSRTSLLLKSITSYFTLSSVSSRLYSSLRSITGYFTLSSAASRLGILLKLLSQSLTTNTLTARLLTGFREASQFFTVSTVSSRINSFLRILSNSLSLNIISSIASSIYKTITSYFTLNQSILRISGIFKSLINSFTTNAITSRFIGFYKPITQLFNLELITIKVQVLLRNIAQSIYTSLISAASIVGFNERIVSLSLTLTDSLTRLLSLYKTLSQSFIANALSSRTGMFFKFISDSVSTNILITRIAEFARLTSQFFSATAITSRIAGFVRLISNAFAISQTTSKLSSLYRSITFYFTINQFSSRIFNLIKILTQSLSINSATIRLSSLFRTIISYFTVNQFSNRFYVFLRSITSYFTTNLATTRIQAFVKSLSNSLILSSTITRTLSSIRSITSYFAVNLIYSRFSVLFRYLSGSFITNFVTSRIHAAYFSISQSFSIITVSSRLSAFLKIISSSFITNQISYRTAVLFKLVTTRTAITDMMSRMLKIQETVSGGLYFSATISRIRMLIRIVSQPISILQIIKRIWIAFSKFLCPFMGDEESCATSGCHWCSGACQATTCVAPTPPSGGGGGGGGLVPVTNVTEIKTVLDTSIDIQTPEVNPGDKVYAIVRVMKVEGPRGVINVNLSYWVKDTSGNILGLKQTVVGVETIRSDIYYLVVPISAPPGTYTFQALAQYNNATDTSFDNFQVTTAVTKPSIAIKRVDVPFILVNENTSIKVILENLENRKIDLNMTLLLPYDFYPQNSTKPISLEPLSEETVEFTFVPKKPGSFSGFIKIEYEDKKLIKDFDIEVYSTEKFFIFLMGNYWWIIALVLIALLAFFIYKTRDRFKKKEKVKYIFKRKELLPEFK